MPWHSHLYSWAFDRTPAPHPPPNPLLLDRIPCQTHQPEAYNQFCLLVSSFKTLWPAGNAPGVPWVLSPTQSLVAEWVGAGEMCGPKEGLRRRTLLNILQFVQSRPHGSVTLGMLRSDHDLRISKEVLDGSSPATFLRNSMLFSLQKEVYGTDVTVVDDYMRVLDGGCGRLSKLA